MKRQFFLFLIFIIGFVSTAISQQVNPDFLFGEFQDAVISFSNGTFSNEKINYNVRYKELHYIDRSDASEKIISNAEIIRVIKIGNRSFVLTKGSLQEILPTTPPIYVEYLPKTQAKAKDAGYGSTSQTSDISSYSIGQKNSFIPDANKLETVGFSKCYWIEKSGDKKKFINFKQFLNIYSKHKVVLNEHIKKNKIEFDDAQMIIDLCLYAESLN